MKVLVHFFANIRERVGTESLEIDLPAGATGAALSAQLVRAYPGLESILPKARLAINLEFKPLESVLADGDEVAIIPPVSGG